MAAEDRCGQFISRQHPEKIISNKVFKSRNLTGKQYIRQPQLPSRYKSLPAIAYAFAQRIIQTRFVQTVILPCHIFIIRGYLPTPNRTSTPD